MLPVNYVYAFSEVIRENRHNRQPRQPDWDGIYHMAAAAGGGRRRSRLPHNFDLPMFPHLDFSHTRRHGHSLPCGLPSDHLVSYVAWKWEKKIIIRCDDATNGKGPGCKTQSHLVATKNIAISHLQYLKIPERPTCAL